MTGAGSGRTADGPAPSPSGPGRLSTGGTDRVPARTGASCADDGVLQRVSQLLGTWNPEQPAVVPGPRATA